MSSAGLRPLELLTWVKIRSYNGYIFIHNDKKSPLLFPSSWKGITPPLKLPLKLIAQAKDVIDGWFPMLKNSSENAAFCKALYSGTVMSRDHLSYLDIIISKKNGCNEADQCPLSGTGSISLHIIKFFASCCKWTDPHAKGQLYSTSWV